MKIQNVSMQKRGVKISPTKAKSGNEDFFIFRSRNGKTAQLFRLHFHAKEFFMTHYRVAVGIKICFRMLKPSLHETV
jgi:hypothetical protein